MQTSNTTSMSQKKAALGYLEALNKWDMDMCMMMLSDSPDFKYEFRPQTLNGCGMPMGYKKDELMTYMSHVKVNIVKEFNFREPMMMMQGKDECAMWVCSNGMAMNNEPYTLQERAHFHDDFRVRHGQDAARRRDDGQPTASRRTEGKEEASRAFREGQRLGSFSWHRGRKDFCVLGFLEFSRKSQNQV